MRGGREALLFHEMGAGFIRHLGDGAQGRRPRIGHKAEIGGLPRPKGGGEKEINQDGNEENGETPSIVPALQQSIDGNALSHAEPHQQKSSQLQNRQQDVGREQHALDGNRTVPVLSELYSGSFCRAHAIPAFRVFP